VLLTCESVAAVSVRRIRHAIGLEQLPLLQTGCPGPDDRRRRSRRCSRGYTGQCGATSGAGCQALVPDPLFRNNML
jgi:hypothetical protein